MTKEEFERFTEMAIEDVVRLAEARVGKHISRNLAFQWMGAREAPIREHIAKTIVDRIFVDDGNIYPCVDLGILDLLDDGTPLLVASVAGYAPQPFSRNWTGRDGPFVRIIGLAFLYKSAGKPWSEANLIHFITPDMANTQEG